MDPTFGHPLWIFVGALLVLVGLWLFLWATGRSASATEQGKLSGLFRRRKSQPNAPSTATTNATPSNVSAFRDHRLLDDHSRTDGRRARGVLSRRIVRCSAGAQRPHCERNAPGHHPHSMAGLDPAIQGHGC